MFPAAAVTHDYKLSGFKQYKRIINSLPCGGQKFKISLMGLNQVYELWAGLRAFWGFWGEPFPLPSVASRGCLHPLAPGCILLTSVPMDTPLFSH